jgi:hypothetical protein
MSLHRRHRRVWLPPCVVMACGVVGSRVAFVSGTDAVGIPFCTKCVSTAIIPPELLVAHTRDLPGFAGAKRSLRSATSAVGYAELVLGDGSSETYTEVLGHAIVRRRVRDRVSVPVRRA